MKNLEESFIAPVHLRELLNMAVKKASDFDLQLLDSIMNLLRYGRGWSYQDCESLFLEYTGVDKVNLDRYLRMIDEGYN